MISYLVVFLGAGIGGMARHGVGAAVMRAGWSGFPVATLIVNIVGCFLMGVIAETFAQKAGLPPLGRLFLTTGVLGGFTTFSAFALDTATLTGRGESLAAAAYVAASVLLSLGAVYAGLHVARMLWVRG